MGVAVTVATNVGVGWCRWVSVGGGGCRRMSAGVGGCRWVSVGVGGYIPMPLSSSYMAMWGLEV
jgi:hypothetical protein